MPSYTAPEILLMIAAIGAIITQSITAWRNGTKLDAVGQDTKVVLGHVNSKETQYTEQLLAKDKEIALLNAMLVSKDKDKDLLAQAVALRTRTLDAATGLVLTPMQPQVSANDAVQREIADNTAETAKAVKEQSSGGNS